MDSSESSRPSPGLIKYEKLSHIFNIRTTSEPKLHDLDIKMWISRIGTEIRDKHNLCEKKDENVTMSNWCAELD